MKNKTIVSCLINSLQIYIKVTIIMYPNYNIHSLSIKRLYQQYIIMTQLFIMLMNNN